MIWLSPSTVFSRSFTLDYLKGYECISINGIYMLEVTDKKNRLMSLTYFKSTLHF